jgi:hypothetical protein
MRNYKALKVISFPFLHVLLLPVFFILHIVNEYYGLIPATYLLQSLLLYLVMALIAWLVGKIICKSFDKAGVWATFLLIIYFFFGAIHDFAKGLSLPSIMVSYSLILPGILLFTILLSVYLVRTKRSFHKANWYLSTLFIVLTGIEIATIFYNLVTHKEDRQHFTTLPPPELQSISTLAGSNPPDIFFIVMDEFASSASLEKYFNYRNEHLDSSLKNNNFFIVRHSKSNYNCTPLSIASTLDLQYFDAPLENYITTTKVALQGWHTLKVCDLPQILKKSGYSIYNFGVCDFTNYPSPTGHYFSDYEKLVSNGETLWRRIERDILWNLDGLNISWLNNTKDRKLNELKNDFIARNRKNLQSILQELKTQSNQPKFVFGHIMMPHAPFYFDRNGNSTHQLITDIYNFKNIKDLYLDQVIYTNTWVDSLIKATNRDFSRPRVVIIEGDHGFRDESPTATREMQFMNLNSWYFSDKNYTMLNDSISPVNTFRIILNKYFNTHFSLLKDSTVLMR